MEKTKITWLGHASASVEFGEQVIYFDPWLDDNPVSTMKTSQVEKATAICVTHGHVDHIGDSFQLVRQTGAKLICSPEMGFYAESERAHRAHRHPRRSAHHARARVRQDRPRSLSRCAQGEQ